MFTIASLVNLLIYLVVVGIVIGLVFYVLDAIPIPEPMNRLIKIACVVIGVLIVVLLLLNLIGVVTVAPRVAAAALIPTLAG